MTRGRLALVLALVPAAILAGGEMVARRAGSPPPPVVREGLEAYARRYQEAVLRLLVEAERTAQCALTGTPEGAAECAPPPLRARLEGTAVVRSGEGPVDWWGSPFEDPARPGYDRAHWEIRVEGVRRSLLATTASDASGRYGLASFTLESTLTGETLEELLPPSLRRGASDAVAFAERSRPAPAESRTPRLTGIDPFRVEIEILDPGGDSLGTATFHEVSPAFVAATVRTRSRAVAAVAGAAILLLVAGAGSPWSLRGRALRSLLAIAAARWLLLATRAPAVLLPRDAGSPSLFGSSRFAGLLQSPADFAITALCALAAAVIVRRYAVRRARDGAIAEAVAVPLLATAAALGWLRECAIALARDARVSPLALGEAASSSGHACLLLGLTFATVAAAACLSATIVAWRRGRRDRRLDVAAMAASGLLAVATLQSASDALVLERLRTEFAPQLVRQSAQRTLALNLAVAEAAQSERTREILASTDRAAAESAAYRLWVGGPLYHRGYKSSLQIFDPSGVLRGQFAFALPPLGEPPPATVPPEGEVVVRDSEEARLAATVQRFVHAEAGVWSGGRAIGTVVGHVLDEPDNLPFLPTVAPYLAAIGPGASRPSPGAEPEYVLYDEAGDVRLHTLPVPPPASASIREAARKRETVDLVVGAERWVGLPLEDGGRLHLLLVPARRWFDLAAGFVRLTVAWILLGAAAFVAKHLFRAGGIGAIVAAVRGSFYRKLLASILLASIAPLIAFSLFLRGYVERRVEANLSTSSAGIVSAVTRTVEDYAAVIDEDREGPPVARLNDAALSWLRGVVGQEIHLYVGGRLEATSKPELFSSGLLLPRLAGEVHRSLTIEGRPLVVRHETLGSLSLPVAYARVDLPGIDAGAVVAVPLVVQQRDRTRGLERLIEILMVATFALAVLLAGVSALVARTVARPVRGLAAAAARIARGDYGTRLSTQSRDEIAALVHGFNAMASALATQRADLERRRDYMEALLGNATSGVVSTDAAGLVVTFNPAAGALLSAVGGVLRPGESLVDAVSRHDELKPLARALSRPPAAATEPEEIDLVVDGASRRIRLVRAALPDPDGGPAGTLHLVDDVTDLMRSNQLAAWGEMARAIAHEIKNPLTPIQLSTEHLERLLRDRSALPDPAVEACLETVLKQVRTLREIAAEFGAYAKLPALRLERCDPAAFLREAVAPYRAAPPDGIAIEERHADAPGIAVDRRVLSRAVVNLVENALQAMPSGGILGVSSGRSGDGGAAIAISDTGPGLAPEVRARLFEPYFSTKSAGTGLGLAIVKRAVEGHGGRIEVDSEPGLGTTFRIVLPPAR